MKFSIITINYNNKEGLRKTIESVVNQTFDDYEYIVIDGGSTDGSIDIIKKYSEKISYWVSEHDKGIYNAMNKGITHAHGEYLNFMNSGDCFHSPDVLEEICPQLHADIVVGAWIKGNNKEAWYFPYTDATLFHLYKWTFNHQSSFFKHHLFKNDLYREDLKIVSDWAFYFQKLIIENCSFQSLITCIADFDDTGVSCTHGEQGWAERKQVLRETLPRRLRDDYEYIGHLEHEFWDTIAILPDNPKVQHLICKIIKISTPIITKLLKIIHKY